MPDLHKIYDAAFFEEWGRDHEQYVQSAEILTDILFDVFHPRTLIDLGCGCGVYSYFFKKKEVEVISVDGVLPPPDTAYPVEIQKRDLTVPLNDEWPLCDLTLCLEVAEHIPEPYLSPFIQNLTRYSDQLLLSAAPPNQGGHHHVNEQPKRYWVKKMSENGFLYNRKKTGEIVEEIKKRDLPYKWMGEHISLYEKDTGKNKNRELAFGTRRG